MKITTKLALLVYLGEIVSIAAAQSITGTITHPSLDRWNYPFASQPGAEPAVPVFAALRQSGFDDRDGQFLIGFDTSALVPTRLGAERYALSSVDVTVWVSADNQFFYDPTFDSVTTSYDPTEPGYTADSDAGKPVELFAVGYRNGWTDQTFGESGPFSPFAPFPPREGVRNAFAAVFGNGGTLIDVSRHVRQHFEAVPMAIGVNASLTPGQLVPAGTPLTFHIDFGNVATNNYITQGLNNGQVRFMISSLEPASGGPGGGTGTPTYPAFFTKENSLAQINNYSASISLDLRVYPGADFNLDGGVDGSDVAAFFMAWEAGDEVADFNIDGGVDGNDVAAFFIAWENG